MKKFFNIIASGDTATIFLYEYIGGYFYKGITGGQIAREVKEAENSFKKIEVRINSNGGEVYEGIAIFNAFRNSKADIRIFVDGIAASMASVIALCGKPVQMSKYARLMLHGVSGGSCGTKADLKEAVAQMEILENTIADMYAKKTGKTPDEIKSAYFDGKDHWLSADEALSLGFIDAVYDADPVPVPENGTIEQIYQIFNNRLNKPQTEEQMSFFENFRKNPSFKNATSDDEVLRIVGLLEAEAAKVPALAGDVQRLTGELKVFRDKAAADENAAKKKLLDDAEADGRINALTRPIYAALLDKDRENGEAALKTLPVKKRIVNRLENSDEPAVGAWDKRQEEISNQSNK